MAHVPAVQELCEPGGVPEVLESPSSPHGFLTNRADSGSPRTNSPTLKR